MRYARLAPLILLVILAMAIGSDAQAQSAMLTLTIPNPSAYTAFDDHFGESVAAVGGNILVGAPRDDPWVYPPGVFVGSAGTVYLFDGTSGDVLLTIANPDPTESDHFGWSVAGVGGNLLVGAYQDDPGGSANAGSAYLLDGTTGALLLTIPNPAPATNDFFGWSVAAVGGDILVGAYADDPGGVTNAGSVYLFDGTTGALLLTIPNPAPADGDLFGGSVAGVGGNILVGAYADDPGGVVDAGSVYLFDGTTGALLLTIPNPSPAIDDRFGGSVAGLGGNALVGADVDDPGGVSAAGSVYLFDGTTGALRLTIPNPAPASGDRFGGSVAGLDGNLLVGASEDSPGGVTDAGSAYLFDGLSGALLLTIPNPAPATNDFFGRSVAAMSGSILVGASRDYPAGEADSGSAYFFCQDLDDDGLCSPQDNCVGIANPDQDDVDTDGIGDACDLGDFDGDLMSDQREYFCGAPPDNQVHVSERVDGAFEDVDDDGDTVVDEALPPGAASFDCDGDGYKGSAEDHVYSYLPQADGDQKTCQEYDMSFPNPNPDVRPSLRWPSDVSKSTGPPNSFNRVNILDITAMLAPVRYMSTSIGTHPSDVRFDISPGGIGPSIGIADLTALFAGPSGMPPMLGGVRAFNGPECPWPE